MEIRIKKLRKSYGKKRVLDIEKLIISEGEITGVIGPNGCGKSTLLNIVSGLEEDFEGKVRYGAYPLSKEIIRKMTYVFQKPYLFKRSVYENIAYPLRIRKIERSEEKKKVLNIIEKLEIQDLTEKRADRLSGGESQKVALARALVFQPELLLLDEPTSNIDPESIKIMEREILSFNKKTRATIWIVTHNMEQAERLCHSIINLEAGKVVEK